MFREREREKERKDYPAAQQSHGGSGF